MSLFHFKMDKTQICSIEEGPFIRHQLLFNIVILLQGDWANFDHRKEGM